MKKVIALLVVLLLCAAVAIPAVATDVFVGSPYQPDDEPAINDEVVKPSIVIKKDEDTNEYVLPEGYENLAQLLESDAFAAIGDCLVITSVTEAEEKTTDISQEARDLLLELYEGMIDGDETLPIDGEYAIRELVDISFKYEGCELLEDHGNKHEVLALPGVTLDIAFDLGVAADETVVVMTYDKDTDTWTEIEEVINNGDGTVSCVFEDICPVAFAVLR